jgi:hypothetical protein
MQQITVIINQIFEIKQKLSQDKLIGKYERNFNRLFSVLEDAGYTVRDPLGEKYTDSRTDCEANIVGKETKNMVITQTLKPVIYQKTGSELQLLQKGLVIVEQNK